jgi:hypothetical protein
VSPISLLPLVISSNYSQLDLTCRESDSQILAYLSRIQFPFGTSQLAHTQCNYLPITRLLCEEQTDVLGEYEDRILQLVSPRVRPRFLSGLKYLTSELMANVREHACIDHYWLFCQYWGKSRTCEIAIADTGIGYKESYVGTPFEASTHFEAIINALEGKSSKDPYERGTGIPSISNIFVRGYDRKLVIMSGDTLIYCSPTKRRMANLNMSYPGSFIGLNFLVKMINILDFI